MKRKGKSIILSVILMTSVLYSSLVRGESKGGNNGKQTLTDEEQEIVEMLDILEEYDFLSSIDLYMNIDEIEKMQKTNNTSGGSARRNEEGK